MNGQESVGLRVKSEDRAFLIDIGFTYGSTEMSTPQRSIFYPGELIHFRTFVSNSQLELSEISPISHYLQPKVIEGLPKCWERSGYTLGE